MTSVFLPLFLLLPAPVKALLVFVFGLGSWVAFDQVRPHEVEVKRVHVEKKAPAVEPVPAP